jgi:uncharacterized protein
MTFGPGYGDLRVARQLNVVPPRPETLGSQTPEESRYRRQDGQPYAESSLAWSLKGSEGKSALLWLVLQGELALAGRGPAFERLFDLRERVLPADGEPAIPDPPRELLLRSARALGVATAKEIAEYFGMGVTACKPVLAALVEEGDLVPVKVSGWPGSALMAGDAPSPEPVEGGALVGPFDSLTWSRPRTKRIFDFAVSFEIYVPEPKRQFGYYVLPFLLDERLVARVDVKAEREAGCLAVKGAYLEAGESPGAVAERLAGELREMASWLSLDAVRVDGRGDLASGLSEAISRG